MRTIRHNRSFFIALYARRAEQWDETRQLIDRIGGTPPEDLPPEPSIRPLLDQQARHQRRLFATTASDAPTLFDTVPDPTSKD